MPLRTRAHELEEESRRAFRATLPARWVFRDMAPDYGLDGEVEIFDERGRQTGDLFKIQLKATDQAGIEDALAVRVPEEHRQYWRQLDIPVLVVRYHAPSRRLFFAWAHDFDPYYGRGAEEVHTFRLAASDEWGAGTADRVAAEVGAIRRFRRAQLAGPIAFSLSILEPQLHGVPAASIVAGVIRVMERLSAYLRLVSAAEPGTPSITVSATKTVVRVPGLPSSTLHTERADDSEYWNRVYASDVVILIASTFGMAGHAKLAAQLVQEVAAESRLLRNPEVTSKLAGAFSHGRLVQEALVIAGRVQSEVASVILSLPAIAHGESLTEQEHGALVALCESRLGRARGVGEAALMATAHYNLGAALSMRSPGKALRHYHQSALDNPEYLGRKYFLAELGGILFRLSRYRRAVRYYERAVDAGEKEARGPLADALLFSGQYRAATETFRRYLEETVEPEAEWWLKERVAAYAMSTLLIEEQERDRRGAAEAVASIARETDDETIGNAMLSALRCDALCGAAWHNLGVVRRRRGEPSLDAMLAAAVLNPGSGKAWMLVFSTIAAEGCAAELQEKVLALACRYSGSELTGELARVAAVLEKETGTPVPNGHEAVQAFAELAALHGGDRHRGVFRLLGEDEYQEIRLNAGRSDR